MGRGVDVDRAYPWSGRLLGGQRSCSRLVLTLALLLTGMGCSSAPRPAADDLEVAEILIDPPFALTEGMKVWAHERVSSKETRENRLRQLLHALHQEGPNGVTIEYQRGYTGTATEVYETRKGNCLSFTHLFVGMARELDVPVYYVEVPRIERYDSGGDLVVVSRHVTAGYGAGPDRMILELLADATDIVQHDVRQISDNRATALHYTNRGAELLQEGRSGEAIAPLRLALELDADLPATWVNLGVALRRQGDFDGAEEAYRAAIEFSPDSVPAYSNLATLLQLRGEPDAAGEILRLLDRRKNRNPFTFLALGDASLRQGQHAEARRFYRRAYRLDSTLAETRAGMGMMYLAEGEIAKAREWLVEAIAIDPENSRVMELSRDLERVDSESESDPLPDNPNPSH